MEKHEHTMWEKFRIWLHPPEFKDENRTRVARLLNAILMVFLVATAIAAVVIPLVNPGGSLVAVFGLAAVSVALLIFIRGGDYRYVQIGSIVLVTATWAFTTFNGWVDGGIRNMATTMYYATVAMAGVLLGTAGVIIFGVLSLLGAWVVYYGEISGMIAFAPRTAEFQDWFKFALILSAVAFFIHFAIHALSKSLVRAQEDERILAMRAEEITQVAAQARQLNVQLEQEVAERRDVEAILQDKLRTIEAQQASLRALSTPVIPLMEGIIVLPLIGGIDSQRAQDIMRALLKGVSEYHAEFVILDVTGVPIMDTGVVNHLNKTIQAARLKGAQTIVTGISDAVAEAVVDLGVDWGAVETLSDLRTGLVVALDRLGVQLVDK
jgi:anti-anti-sigma regulatory factor